MQKKSPSSSSGSSRKSSEDLNDLKGVDLVDPSLEKDYLESVRKQTAKGRTITTVGSGILLAAAGGTILGPLVAIPAAIVGMGAGYRMFKNRERRQVDKAEKMLASGDHAADNLPGEEGSSRPPLRRLIFLARWASLQIATDLDNGDLKPARLERVFDETILSFSAWVQRIYYARAEKKAYKRDQDEKLLKLHLSPLVRWLGSSPSNEVFMMVNHEFAKEAAKLVVEGSEKDHTRIVRRCRSVFPVIVEVYQLFKLGEESKVGQLVLWISEFLRQKNINAFLAEAVLLHSHPAPLPPHHPADDGEEEDHVEFPPLGVEQELEEEEFFSASEGEEECDDPAVSAHIARQASRVDRGAISPSSVVEGVDNTKLFKRAKSERDNNTWLPLDATLVNVRGPNYLEDKLKIPSKECMFEMLCFDLFYTDFTISCVSANKNCKAYWLLQENPDLFIFTVNWRLHPMQATVTYGINKSTCDWIKRGDDCPEKILLERFLEASHDVKNQTIKVIPKVTEGPWLVRKAVGQTPAILGKKLKVDYHQDPGRFFEAEYDVLSTTAAKSMIGLVVGAAKRLVIDVAILLEGKEADELPERILGGFRVFFPDLASCRRITIGAPVGAPRKRGQFVNVNTDDSDDSNE